MVPSHQFARSVLSIIDKILSFFGLSHSDTLEEIIYVIVICAVALLLGWLLRKVILWALRRWVKMRNPSWGRELLRAGTLGKCCHAIPPLVLLACLPIAFDTSAAWHVWIMRAIIVYLLITIGIGISAVFKYIWIRYDSVHNERHLPLKGIYDVAIGIVWIIVAIIAVSVLINRSPAVLLGGLGAFAAALMLIFKDSILGFVAGFQMSANDMLHVGDWIIVPNTPANGVVIDVTISVVKVQNFDNTLVMLPPYTLVSTSFQNWRGMSDSGIRNIARNILIDAATIVPDKDDPSTTNLTKFRAWVLDYLNKHPRLDHSGQGNSLTMVRLMPAEAAGIPMQLYCFTNTTDWVAYEAIQSEIIEHVIAAASGFSLTVYNYPTTLQ